MKLIANASLPLWMILILLLMCEQAPAADPHHEAVSTSGSFWNLWGDGQAEMATYRMTIERYGQRRSGTAVTVFVTERFSHRQRVKVDSSAPDAGDYSVMKLNLIKDFTTGVYDYNLMTSVFVNLEAFAGRPAGAATKVSFSSQEWCGHVYEQLLFDSDAIRRTMHSYFEGESDVTDKLPYPEDGLSADALLHWARGLAWPVLAPGEERPVQLLTSLQTARLKHRSLSWTPVLLARSRDAERLTVPAGTFDVEVFVVRHDGGPLATFYVEKSPPRRIVKWELPDEQAELLGTTRMKYWQLSGNGDQAARARIGLEID